MAKKLCIILICCCSVIFSGCYDNKNPKDTLPDELSAQEEIAASDAEQSTEKQLKARDRKIDTEKEFVFDDAGILTDGEYDNLNNYVAWFSKAFKINAAVVLTDDIEDSEPSEYAKNYYNALYKGDGILFLINNDTGEDHFYRNGVPAAFISDSDVLMLFSEISPMLALENYVAAAELVLETAEGLLPEYFTDRSGVLKKEEISQYNKIIEKAAGDNSLNIYYVEGTGNDSLDDFSKKRFKMFYEENADAAMLVIDGNNGESYLCASGSMSYMTENRAELEKEIKDCYTKTEGVDLKTASEIFVGYTDN